MYYIAKTKDLNTIKSSYGVCAEYCLNTLGYELPTYSDEDFENFVDNQQVLISDIGDYDDFRANVCFSAEENYVMINWTIPDFSLPGATDAMLSYLILHYKKPIRYWMAAGSATEEETVSPTEYYAENTTLVSEEYRGTRLFRLYEFTAPELALFKEG